MKKNVLILLMAITMMFNTILSFAAAPTVVTNQPKPVDIHFIEHRK